MRKAAGRLRGTVRLGMLCKARFGKHGLGPGQRTHMPFAMSAYVEGAINIFPHRAIRAIEPITVVYSADGSS